MLMPRQTITEEKANGAVTAIDQVGNHVIAAVGPKVRQTIIPMYSLAIDSRDQNVVHHLAATHC